MHCKYFCRTFAIMSERKKAEKKEIPKIEPKKREVPIEVPNIETNKDEVKQKRVENKYTKLALDANQEERKVFSDKVKSGELKFAYYALEGEKGYHFYQILKK